MLSNLNKGKATLKITGIESQGVKGILTYKYDIKPMNISDAAISVDLPDKEAYAKGGSKPIPTVTLTLNDGSIRQLRERVDYKLTYANSSKLGDTGKLTITGIGNFEKSRTLNYEIIKQDIANTKVVTMDKVLKAKAKGTYFESKPKVYDLDGKQLTENKDYTVRYMYNGVQIDKNTVIEENGVVNIIITGIGTYEGSTEASYRIRVLKNLSSVKADKIADKQYTGRAIRPDNELKLYTTVKSGKNTVRTDLVQGTDYEIVLCYNNIKKGTATYLLRGKGDYTGFKTVTFKIKQAKFKKIIF